MIDGFYTATCGSPTFDQDIDNEIGFLDFDSSDYSASLKDFAPGLIDDDSASDTEDFGLTEGRRAALKRRSCFGSLGKLNLFFSFENDSLLISSATSTVYFQRGQIRCKGR